MEQGKYVMLHFFISALFVGGHVFSIYPCGDCSAEDEPHSQSSTVRTPSLELRIRTYSDEIAKKHPEYQRVPPIDLGNTPPFAFGYFLFSDASVELSEGERSIRVGKNGRVEFSGIQWRFSESRPCVVETNELVAKNEPFGTVTWVPSGKLQQRVFTSHSLLDATLKPEELNTPKNIILALQPTIQEIPEPFITVWNEFSRRCEEEPAVAGRFLVHADDNEAYLQFNSLLRFRSASRKEVLVFPELNYFPRQSGTDGGLSDFIVGTTPPLNPPLAETLDFRKVKHRKLVKICYRLSISQPLSKKCRIRIFPSPILPGAHYVE